MDALTIVAVVVVVGMAVAIARTIRVRDKQRRQPPPSGWQPDTRPEQVRLKSYTDEKLDELRALGIQVKLDHPGDRNPAMQRYADEIEAIEQWARTRELP